MSDDVRQNGVFRRVNEVTNPSVG